MGYVLAVIGGSGLYEMDGLSHVQEVPVSTPYGEPVSYTHLKLPTIYPV